jgi:hypothetical protein
MPADPIICDDESGPDYDVSSDPISDDLYLFF